MTPWVFNTESAVLLLLVTARVAGIFLVAPVFSSSAFPLKLRLLMSVVIAWALIIVIEPVGGNLERAASGPVILAVVLGVELAIGATIGYAARLVLAGVELGAFHIGQQMGLSLAESYQSDSPETSGILRRFMYLLAVVIFLCIGGHRQVLWALRKSFQTIPPACVPAGQGLLAIVVTLLEASFVLALKVAAPVLIAMALATVALGVLQRTVPQCNTLTIGLPVRVLTGLVVLAVSLATLAGPIGRALNLTFTRLSTWSLSP